MAFPTTATEYTKVQISISRRVSDLLICLQVYDARSDFGTFCGTELPPVFTSTANELFVEFSSDDSINDAGFLAVYTAIGNAMF